jgi:hypothetical protein
VEPGSTGISYAESAGEGAIRSNPYLFREVGFGWVNGGPFFGDYPRDLALDVDAVCLVDGDGDLSEEGVDCDDADPLRSPNFPEQCGGVDEDCDGTDVYAPPSGYTAFTSVTRSEVTWYEMPEATAYDVVYGVLKQLRDSGGDFTTAACFRDQVAGTTLDITALPSNTWFLVRQTNVCGGGFYDDFSPGLVDYRTDEIVASPNTCP